MTRALVTLLIGLWLAAAPACGRKGPLELPPGRAPMPVERLTAVWRDGAVLLEWTNPVKTVAGSSLGPLGDAEIWVFERDAPAAGAALAPAAVERSARLAGRVAVGGAAASSFVFEPRPDGPTSLAFTVRVLDRKGRASDYCPPAVASIARAGGGRA